MKSSTDRFFKILTESNLLTEAQVQEVLTVQKTEGGKLGQILVEKKFLNENAVICALSDHLSIPPLDLGKVQIEPSVIAMVPKDVAYFYQLIPVSHCANSLTVAMTDPLNVFAMDDLKILLGIKINPVVCTAKSLSESLNRYYSNTAMSEMVFGDSDITKVEDQPTDKEVDVDNLVQEAEGAPVVKAVNFLISNAVKDKASDIHLEPYQDVVRLRYRVDGALFTKATFPKKLQMAMTSRIKIMSNMDITEKRLPQDGRFRVKTAGRNIDFRVSTLPTAYGEKVVMRILDKTSVKLDIHTLGFHPQGLGVLEKCLKMPYGMILVTGPTGSGKTTTLYAALSEINKPTTNIITVEDPIEYQLHEINQVQVKADIGFTFANALRSILRQDPNVVMIGEIRDQETVDIAIRAALTGHLVLSTLHTNDAAGAISRLLDMGVEPFLMSSALLMIAAQRLVRRICSSCKHVVQATDEILDNAQMPHQPGEEIKIYKGRGCKRCMFGGYAGRYPLIEVLQIDDDIRSLMVKKGTAREVKKFAIQRGMKTLRMVGLDAVLEGHTTLEEVVRETAAD